MGELLFCQEPIASLPYYVEGIGINLYSMEELCYYIACNPYLLDHTFMNEELCVWMEEQMKLYKLAKRLRDMIHQNSRLSEFALAILESTGYTTPGQTQEIIAAIRQMEEKSEYECNKIRADQFMENEKYLAAIYEYKKLLETPEETDKQLIGNIWHNLGTAYARLFLFEEAAECYRKAYARNQTGESLRECMLCYCCMHDEERFCALADEHQLDERGRQEIRNEWRMAQDGEVPSAEDKEEVRKLMLSWKENYRRSCKV